MPFKNDRQRKAVMAKLSSGNQRGASSSTIDKIDGINPLKLKSNRLPLQFAVIVPSTIRDRKIKAGEFNKRVDSEKKFLDKTFGGDTTVRAVGSFVDKNKLIKEKTAIVEASTTPAKFNKERKNIETHLKRRRIQWKQNSLFYKIEGEGFIYPKQKFVPSDDKRKKIIIS